MKIDLKELFTENLSYKLVSLLIALILWVTILGRRDFSLTKTIDVELIPGSQQTLSMVSSDTVRVKVSGPRTALKKFMETGMSQLITIDVSQFPSGDFEVDIPVRQIDVPFGVKVISLKPSAIKGKINPKN
jgi:YbbR domain-containing protein